jgi:hypothetical protein
MPTLHCPPKIGHASERDPIKLMKILPIDPVEQVHGSIATQNKQVVGRDGLGLACPLKHEQLRQDSQGLQKDGEGP